MSRELHGRNGQRDGTSVSLGELKRRCFDAMMCASDGKEHAAAWRRTLFTSGDGDESDLTQKQYMASLAWSLDRERRTCPDCGQVGVKDRNRFRVFKAYYAFLNAEKRPPLIGELLERVEINKPKRCERNMQEWQKINNRERTIRGYLKEGGLVLSKGKRGRRWNSNSE